MNAPSLVRPSVVRPLADVEREAILAALAYFGGDRNRAAAALGISRRTLGLRIKAYGDVPPQPPGPPPASKARAIGRLRALEFALSL